MPKGRHYRIQLADTLDAHDKAIKTGGGRKGIISSHLIESAIARPYSGYYSSIYKKAAAITHSMCRNHGFTDGNKRTALYLVELLVEQSGYKFIRILQKEFEDFLVDVADGTLSFDEVVSWYKKRIQPSD